MTLRPSLKLLAALGASGGVIAATVEARADPVSIGFALFAGPLGSVFSFGTLVNAAAIGLAVAGTAAQIAYSLLTRPRNNTDPGQYKNTFETAESSEVNAIGRVALGGLKAFGNTAGLTRYRLIAHAKGPLVAIEEHRLGNREVTVEANGDVSSPPYARGGGSWVNIQTKIGDGTETAWGALTSAFPSLWSADHRLRGIAQSLVQYVSPGITTEKFGKLYQGGEPELSIVARMNCVYDPRVPGADANDPATWVWSTNGPLCAARIMLDYPDLTVASFDWAFIAAEATRADATVATLTGTEPRSRCSGVWLSESVRTDTMQDVLASIGAEIVTGDDGLIRIRLIDDAPVADLAIAERDILDWSWRAGPEAVERPNACRVRFYSAERNYEMTDLDMTGIGWARIDDEIARYGEKLFDVELPFCPSASQAQRIARRLFLSARADSGVIRTNWSGLAAWGLTYAAIDVADLGGPTLCRMDPPRVDDQAGAVEIPYLVWPLELATPFDPATMEAPAPEPLPDLQYEATLATPAAPSAAALVQLTGGAYELRLIFAGVAGAVTAEATYRTYTAGLPNPWAGMTEVDRGAFWLGYTAANTTGLDVDFRVRFFDADEEGSYFSDLLEASAMAIDNTAPAAPDVDEALHDSGSGTDGLTLTIAPTAINLVRLLVEKNFDGEGWSTAEDVDPARPGAETVVELFPYSNVTASPKVLQWRASVFTSNGTQSAYASGDLTFPGIAP